MVHARFGLWLEHGLDIRSSWDVISVAMMRGANRACARSPKALRLITQPTEAWTPAKSLRVCINPRELPIMPKRIKKYYERTRDIYARIQEIFKRVH